MKFSGGTLLALLFIGMAGGIYYYEYFAKGGPHAPLKETPPPVTEVAATPPAPHYPVPDAEEKVEDEAPPHAMAKGKKKSLPAEKKGPVSIEDALIALFGASQANNLFDLDGFAGHFVVAVENEASPQIPPQFLPMKQAEGTLAVKTDNGETTLDPKNYQRYTPYVHLLDLVSSQKLADFYVHYYPLFQKTYRDNGSQGYFNDKVVAAVENLQATPDVKDPIKLTQPNVFYHYADPQLESLSAGQKILLRMGPENSARVKKKLGELHELLTHLGNKAAG